LYQAIHYERRKNKIHIWDDKTGHLVVPYKKYAYIKNSSGQHFTLDGDKVKKIVEKDKDMDLFKIRVSYEWTKQDLDGHQVRITPKESYGMTPKSAPFKVFIELGGKDSVIHDENWQKFVEKGLVKG